MRLVSNRKNFYCLVDWYKNYLEVPTISVTIFCLCLVFILFKLLFVYYTLKLYKQVFTEMIEYYILLREKGSICKHPLFGLINKKLVDDGFRRGLQRLAVNALAAFTLSRFNYDIFIPE